MSAARGLGHTWALEPFCTRIVVYWTLLGPGGKPFGCELCRTEAGLEVRCAFGGRRAIRAERVESAAEAGDVAALWKTSFLLQDGYCERPCDGFRDDLLDIDELNTVLEQKAMRKARRRMVAV